MAAGNSVIIELLMRTATFVTDTARASKSLKQLQKDAEEAGKIAGGALVGAGIGIALMVRASIDAADHLNDLSKKTGIAADTLGGIGFAAGQAGGNLESAAAAAGKLNKTIAEAAAGNKEAAEFFKALGISVLDASGNTKKADAVLAEIADKFEGYADGPEKAALALRGFGKAGADIIPLLDDGGRALLENIDYFKRYSGVTVETAEKADQFNDTLGKIKLLSGAFSQELAGASLPLLQTLADRFLSAKESGDGLKTMAEGIVGVFRGLVVAGAYVADTFGGVGREIGAVIAQAVALTHLDFKGFTAIGDSVKADGVQAKKSLDDFVAAIYATKKQVSAVDYSNEGRNAKPPGKPNAPRLPSSGTGEKDTAGAELKKKLDGELKLIEQFQRARGDAFQYGNQFLEGVYQDGLVSQAAFFEEQRQLRAAALQSELDTIDKEIAAETRFANSKITKPTDRVAAEEKIKLAIQQRADAVIKGSYQETLANQANQRAVEQLSDSYAGVQASILAMQGDELGAAQIKTAQQVRDASRLVQQAGGDPSLAVKLKTQLDGQAALNDLSSKYSLILGDLQMAEQRIGIAQQSGSTGEIDSLTRTGQARQKAIALLEAQLAAFNKLDAGARSPQQVQQIEQLKLKLEELKATIDPLALKLNGIFEDSFGNAFADFISGSKSASEAFSDFSRSVLREVSNLAAKDIAKSIFGGDGGIGGTISKFLGGSGGGSGVASGGSAAAGASSTSWLSTFASFIGSFFDEGGYTGDMGTKQPAGIVHGGEFVFSAPAVRTLGLQRLAESHRAARVGRVSLPGFESGGFVGRMPAANADMFRPRTAGMAEPAFSARASNGPSMNVTQNFSVTGPIDRRTEQQIAAAAALGGKRALARGS